MYIFKEALATILTKQIICSKYILAILYTFTVFHQHEIEQLFWV
jgi:hypothetical protein